MAGSGRANVVGRPHFWAGSLRAPVSALYGSAGRILLDIDQFAATGTHTLPAVKGQAAFALVQCFGAAGVGAEIERNPAFTGFVGVLTIGGAAISSCT